MKLRSYACRGAATLAATVCALSASAQAPKEAICALQQAVACGSVATCERALPAASNLPALMRFNVEKGVVESRHEDGEVRTSKIASSSTHGDGLILQGNDEGHPWAMRVNTTTGQMTLSVMREDEGYIGFGVCSAKILK